MLLAPRHNPVSLAPSALQQVEEYKANGETLLAQAAEVAQQWAQKVGGAHAHTHTHTHTHSFMRQPCDLQAHNPPSCYSSVLLRAYELFCVRACVCVRANVFVCVCVCVTELLPLHQLPLGCSPSDQVRACVRGLSHRVSGIQP